MRRLLVVLLLTAVWVPGFAQQPVDVPASIAPFVKAEYDFTRTAKEKGTRDAFLEFLADDSVLFRPTAVPGKQWVEKGPAARDWLNWYPIFADAAASGDLGYTTGPWDYRNAVTDEQAVAFGHYVTVWKKQADGSFKAVIDAGIRHSQPKEKAAPTVQMGIPSKASPTKKVEVAKEAEALLKADEAFSKLSEEKGVLPAYLYISTPDVRVYRVASLPFVGKDKLRGVFINSDLKVVWKPAKADVAKSGDLGYTYGVSERSLDLGPELLQKPDADKPAVKVEKSAYLRIWKKQADGQWKLVLDVENPIPEKSKN